jgi:hypothetical protein
VGIPRQRRDRRADRDPRARWEPGTLIRPYFEGPTLLRVTEELRQRATVV